MSFPLALIWFIHIFVYMTLRREDLEYPLLTLMMVGLDSVTSGFPLLGTVVFITLCLYFVWSIMFGVNKWIQWFEQRFSIVWFNPELKYEKLLEAKFNTT